MCSGVVNEHKMNKSRQTPSSCKAHVDCNQVCMIQSSHIPGDAFSLIAGQITDRESDLADVGQRILSVYAHCTNLCEEEVCSLNARAAS